MVTRRHNTPITATQASRGWPGPQGGEPRMATDRPLPCITCHQPLPEGLNRIGAFAQLPLLPSAADLGDLQHEVTDIIEYIDALFQLPIPCPQDSLDHDLLSVCFELGSDLAKEAQRHLARAHEAWELQEQDREAEARSSTVQGPH